MDRCQICLEVYIWSIIIYKDLSSYYSVSMFSSPPFTNAFCDMKELASALVDRDRAICEKNELLEKYCHEVKDKAEARKELSLACKDIETVREERDVARKERTEAIIQRDQLLREYYQARQVARQTGDLS